MFSVSSPNKLDSEYESNSGSEVSFGWEKVLRLQPDSMYNAIKSEGVYISNKGTNEGVDVEEQIDESEECDSSDSKTFTKSENRINGRIANVSSELEERSHSSVNKEETLHSQNLITADSSNRQTEKMSRRMKETYDLSNSENDESDNADDNKNMAAVNTIKSRHNVTDLAVQKSNLHQKDMHTRLKENAETLDGDNRNEIVQEEDLEISCIPNMEEYRPVKIEHEFNLEDLKEEEEIWMLQCPLSLDLQKLRNTKFVFGETSEFTIRQEGEEVYEAISYLDRNKSISCLLPNTKKNCLKAKVLQPAGLIIITEKVEVPNLEMTTTSEQKFQIPDGLKIRHPLFGSDYKEELQLRKGLTNIRYGMVNKDFFKQSSRTKKKKKKHEKCYDGLGGAYFERQLEATENNEDCENGNWQTNDERQQEFHHKKNKKKNKQKDESNSICKKNKKITEDAFESSISLFDDIRKKKEKNEEMSVAISNHEYEIDNHVHPTGHREHKRKKIKGVMSINSNEVFETSNEETNIGDTENNESCGNENWQISKEREQEFYHKKKKKNNKQKNENNDVCKRKRKFTEDVFESSTTLSDTKRRKKSTKEEMSISGHEDEVNSQVHPSGHREHKKKFKEVMPINSNEVFGTNNAETNIGDTENNEGCGNENWQISEEREQEFHHKKKKKKNKQKNENNDVYKGKRKVTEITIENFATLFDTKRRKKGTNAEMSIHDISDHEDEVTS